MDDKELVAIGTTPGALIARASDAAGACRAIVEATAQQIGGKRYVRVEGWEAIAVAHGCVASAGNVERVDTGFRAVGEIRRIDTGILIAHGEGFVGDDEPMWAKRTEHARRAMAQTRAISRACRSAFAHVVVMMQAGLETTPAEEMVVEENGHDSKPPRPITARTMAKEKDDRRMRAAAELEQRIAAKADDPQPTAPAMVVEGTLERVVVKSGSTRGKEWTRYGLLIDGIWYGTFDRTLGEYARGLDGQLVTAQYEQGSGDRLNVVGLAPQDEAEWTVPDEQSGLPY